MQPKIDAAVSAPAYDQGNGSCVGITTGGGESSKIGVWSVSIVASPLGTAVVSARSSCLMRFCETVVSYQRPTSIGTMNSDQAIAYGYGKKSAMHCYLIAKTFGILALLSTLAPGPAPGGTNPAADVAGVTFYVAVDGNDSWSGRIATPNATSNDGPFATLARARDAVRSAKPAAPAAPIRVLVRSGKYFMTEPLLLDESDSGSASSPIVWAAFPNEQPVCSGGRPLGGWNAFKGRILAATLPVSASTGVRPLQLFHKGNRQILARSPNFDRANPLYGGWAWMEAAAGPGAFRYGEGLFPALPLKPGQAEVFQFVGPSGGWGSQFLAITAIDPQRRIIHTRYDQGESTLLGFNGNCRFFVENALELLDQPGEWCADTEAGQIYFWPPDGLMPGTDCALAALPSLLVMSNAKWITISGLTFTETAAGGPAGLWCESVEHVQIVKNRFIGLGSRGLEIAGRKGTCLDVTIQGNEIAGTGSGGIYIGGSVRDCKVLDNEVHHCAVFDKYSAGIEFPFYGGTAADVGPGTYTDRVTVAHNHVHDLPRDGIQLGANPFGRNVVEFNRVERAAAETIDAGAIRCHRVVSHLWGIAKLPPMAGHTIRHNVVVDIRGCGAQNGRIVTPQPWPTFGIYLDEGSSNCTVFGNFVLRSGTGAIINPGASNVIENNLFVGNDVGIYYQAPAPFDDLSTPLGGNRLVRNIIEMSTPKSTAYTLKNWTTSTLAESDYNVFWNKSAPCALETQSTETKRATNRTLAEWQQAGYDAHSQLADPLIENSATGNYSLKQRSPALEIGFIPIDVARAGIRPQWLRK
jgi:Right handed beta helix region